MAQFTRRAIMESFMRLVGKKPLDKITVKDIVEDCEITRNTFYYHFQDIYDLTAEVFRNEFSNIIQRRGSQGNWSDQLWDIALFARENRSAILHIYNSARQAELVRVFERSADEYMLQIVRSYPEAAGVAEEDIRLIAALLRCSIMGVARNWLDKGMREDPSPVMDRAKQLFEGLIPAALCRSAQLSKTGK